MASKEERERRRAERLAAQQRQAEAERRRQIVGYVVAGALTFAVIVGIVVVVASGGSNQAGAENVCANAHVQLQSGFLHDVPLDCREGTPPPPLKQGDLQKAAAAAHCVLRLNLPEEGRSHITDPNQIPNYGTNPPTSGNHNPEQMADGAYREMPQNWYFVHSLEHGRIEIQYSPKLPEQDQLALKGVFDENPDGVLLFPNRTMPYEVAVTAWTQLMGCPKYDGPATLDAIRDFRDIYRGNGPESAIPISLSG